MQKGCCKSKSCLTSGVWTSTGASGCCCPSSCCSAAPAAAAGPATPAAAAAAAAQAAGCSSIRRSSRGGGAGAAAAAGPCKGKQQVQVSSGVVSARAVQHHCGWAWSRGTPRAAGHMVALRKCCPTSRGQAHTCLPSHACCCCRGCRGRSWVLIHQALLAWGGGWGRSRGGALQEGALQQASRRVAIAGEGSL